MIRMKRESLCLLGLAVRGNYGGLVHKGLMLRKLRLDHRRGQQVFARFSEDFSWQ